jgi:uncharacterized protein
MPARRLPMFALFLTACSAPPSPPPPPVIVQVAAPQAAAPAPAAAAPAAADPRAAYIRSHYTKYEHRVPMRDGVKLFTAVYVPNDASERKRYPLLLTRTPYSVKPYGADRYPDQFGLEVLEREGYIFVRQDVRGRYMSEGEFVNVRPHNAAKAGPADIDESSDTYDTIEWLVKNVPYNNGRVGQWGVSYPGFYTAAGAIDSHPALKAISPQAPVADWWHGDDMHRNGAFNLQETFTFFATFGKARPAPTDDEERVPFDFGTPDAYQFFLSLGPLSEVDAEDFKAEIAFWKEVAAHPDYDEFWRARNILPRLRGVKAASLVVGGWYDTENLYGALETYRSIEAQNPGVVNTLIMGPWQHGGWNRYPGDKLGDDEMGFATSEPYRELLAAFFKYHLKGGDDPGLPEAYVFETGADRWRRFSAWPPREARDVALYLREGGALSPEAPADEGAAFDEYISDPAKPVPYTQKPLTKWWSTDYMAEDQRFAASRPDVLVYETAPLERDVTITGPVSVELYAATSGTDADFVVKLIDVNPPKMPGWTKDDDRSGKLNRGGQQTLVRGEPFRGRYREADDAPKPFVPNEPAAVRFALDDVFHTFQRGHRIMIQVQSSWFPFVDRNPQTFVPNIFEAKREDFIKASHQIHRAKATPSAIRFKVLPAPGDQAP